MLITRAILSSYHVHLDNGDKGFVPYTHLLIRLEVVDGNSVISSATQSAQISHDSDVAAQMANVNKTTLNNGFSVMDQSQLDKLTDHFASIAVIQAKGI